MLNDSKSPIFTRTLLVVTMTVLPSACGSSDSEDTNLPSPPPTNVAPIFSSQDTSVSTENQAYYYTPVASDADNDTLSLRFF